MSDRIKRYLRRYSKLNLALLPLSRGRRGDAGTGKQPRIKGGYSAAAIGLREIEALFDQLSGDSNIGIATGRVSGVIVIDVDPKHGGNDTLRKLEEELGGLPNTWEVRTSNGGRHFYFLCPPFAITRDTAGKLLGSGLDLLGEKSVAVAPPSKHHTGHIYEWADKRRLADPAAKLPERWLSHLQKRIVKKVSPRRRRQTEAPPISEGRRNTTLYKLGCGYHAGGADETELLKRLETINERRCDPPLSKEEIGEIHRSIQKHARGSKPDLASIAAQSVLAGQFAGGEDLVHHAGRFYRYVGTHWVETTDDYLKKQVLKEIQSWPNRSHERLVSRMNEAVALLRAWQETEEDPFKEEPLRIINCQNGELHLKDDGRVKLRSHDRNSWQQRILPIEYDPEATCPQYDTALMQIFSEATEPSEMVRHWHELTGYTIQPDRHHPTIAVLQGPGGNGKTKLAGTLCRLLGTEGACFMSVEGLETRFALATLKGKLMFVDDDVKMRLRLPDSLLKKISEQKEITTEEKFKNARTFTSRAIPYLLCNGVPHLQDPSEGIRRRLHVLPFNKRFKGSEKDPTLFDRIWAEELPGILNRALEGWKRLTQRGDFEKPEDVEREIMCWLRQAHPTSTFLEDEIERESDGRVLLAEVYNCFKEWTKDAGVQRPVTRAQFAQELEHLGFLIKKSNGHRTVYGLRLKQK